jgi:tetratricopeptide (TPR) repeat protein
VDVITPLEETIASEPNNFEALKRLAVEYYIIEEDDLALEKVDRALALRRDPGLLTLRGFLLNFRGDRIGALAAMEEASGEGKSTLALKWAAIIADDAGEKERARTYIAEIEGIRPDDPFIREMNERASGGTAPYPTVGYWIVFQGNGARPLEAAPVSRN